MRAALAYPVALLWAVWPGAIGAAQTDPAALTEAMKLNFRCLTDDGGVCRRAILNGQAAEVLDSTIALLLDAAYMDSTSCRYGHVAERLGHLLGPQATQYVCLQTGMELAPQRAVPAHKGPEGMTFRRSAGVYDPLGYAAYLQSHAHDPADKIIEYEAGPWRDPHAGALYAGRTAALEAVRRASLGEDSEAQGMFAVAAERLTAAVEDARDLHEALLSRAETYALWGKAEAALEDYAQACELAPGSPWPHYCRAELYDTLNRPDEAAGDRARARDLILESMADWAAEH
jgi:tetratricopeptide (TPR) repeat protein